MVSAKYRTRSRGESSLSLLGSSGSSAKLPESSFACWLMVRIKAVTLGQLSEWNPSHVNATSVSRSNQGASELSLPLVNQPLSKFRR